MRSTLAALSIVASIVALASPAAAQGGRIGSMGVQGSFCRQHPGSVACPLNVIDQRQQPAQTNSVWSTPSQSQQAFETRRQINMAQMRGGSYYDALAGTCTQVSGGRVYVTSGRC